MPYSLSLTESTSKNFSTFLKAMLVLFPLGLVAMIMTYIHANNLWWFFGTVVFSVLGIVYVFGWIFYRQRGDQLRMAYDRIARLEQLLERGPVNVNVTGQNGEGDKKSGPMFEVYTEASPQDRELSPDEYRRREEWYRETQPQDRQPIGYPTQNTSPPLSADGWYRNPYTGQYFRRKR